MIDFSGSLWIFLVTDNYSFLKCNIDQAVYSCEEIRSCPLSSQSLVAPNFKRLSDIEESPTQCGRLLCVFQSLVLAPASPWLSVTSLTQNVSRNKNAMSPKLISVSAFSFILKLCFKNEILSSHVFNGGYLKE